MHTWPIQDAKARFSEFLDACPQEGPQMVMQPSLKELLLSEQARTDMTLPARGQTQRRKVELMR